jgi:hypothetical protein
MFTASTSGANSSAAARVRLGSAPRGGVTSAVIANRPSASASRSPTATPGDRAIMEQNAAYSEAPKTAPDV